MLTFEFISLYITQRRGFWVVEERIRLNGGSKLEEQLNESKAHSVFGSAGADSLELFLGSV
jgi:hypothetical protein